MLNCLVFFFLLKWELCNQQSNISRKITYLFNGRLFIKLEMFEKCLKITRCFSKIDKIWILLGFMSSIFQFKVDLLTLREILSKFLSSLHLKKEFGIESQIQLYFKFLQQTKNNKRNKKLC